METIRDFLAILRTDRKREIARYKEQNYLVSKGFMMVRKISYDDLEIGVQVNSQDYYFYLINNGQNAYFSIRELYYLLYSMASNEGSEYVCDLLRDQIGLDEKSSLRYEDINYEIKKSIIPDRNGGVRVDDGSIDINYKQMFGLINLIQEKSNSLFENSPGNEQYKNGILRLLMTLIECEKDHVILQDKGWFYNTADNCFFYKEILNEEDKKRKKYYLTEAERDSIMSLES